VSLFPAQSPQAITDRVHSRVAAAAPRIARLGRWPDWIPPSSLALRVPHLTSPAPAGFDAGIACALDLIPSAAQPLSATLHAAYTPAAIAQVRSETDHLPLTPDSQTTWWLAACSVCDEGVATPASFAAQLERFAILRADPFLRVRAAIDCLFEMRVSFEIRHGVAFALVDGGMQGAYIAGHELAASYSQTQDLYFIGTYLPSLGLDDFPWANPANPSSSDPSSRLGRSGPVHGSKQYVKCQDLTELLAALAAVSLTPPPPS
jgi:hypothetical protein